VWLLAKLNVEGSNLFCSDASKNAQARVELERFTCRKREIDFHDRLGVRILGEFA